MQALTFWQYRKRKISIQWRIWQKSPDFDILEKGFYTCFHHALAKNFDQIKLLKNFVKSHLVTLPQCTLYDVTPHHSRSTNDTHLFLHFSLNILVSAKIDLFRFCAPGPTDCTPLSVGMQCSCVFQASEPLMAAASREESPSYSKGPLTTRKSRSAATNITMCMGLWLHA